jgi:hypothetical protein
MSIDFLFCNTQMEGQLESQCEVVKVSVGPTHAVPLLRNVRQDA